MVKVERLNMEEITPVRVLNNQNEYELALAIKMQRNHFNKIKHGGSIEVKSLLVPDHHHNELAMFLFLRLKQEPKIMCDGVLDITDELVQQLIEQMKESDELKIIFIDEKYGDEFVFEWEHRLSGYIRNIENQLEKNNWEITQDMGSSLQVYRSKTARNQIKEYMRQMAYGDLWSYISENLGLEQPRLHAISIDSLEVRQMDFRRIDQAIELLKVAGLQSREKLMLTFQGYETTPMEIYEIGEIRRYVKQLFAKHRNLFYFLTGERFNNLLILNCLLVLWKSGYRSGLAQVEVDMRSSKNILINVAVGIQEFSQEIGDIRDQFPITKFFKGTIDQFLSWLDDENNPYLKH